jgi:ABC-type enterochelin transport system substrate-binding protein
MFQMSEKNILTKNPIVVFIISTSQYIGKTQEVTQNRLVFAIKVYQANRRFEYEGF